MKTNNMQNNKPWTIWYLTVFANKKQDKTCAIPTPVVARNPERHYSYAQTMMLYNAPATASKGSFLTET